MKPVEFVLPLLAALWASGSLFFVASKERNEKRDRILSGYLEGRKLSQAHRLLLLKSDWLPLCLILINLAVTLAVVSICLPILLEAKERNAVIWVVKVMVASYSLTCSTAWLWNGEREYMLMIYCINNNVYSGEIQGDRPTAAGSSPQEAIDH